MADIAHDHTIRAKYPSIARDNGTRHSKVSREHTSMYCTRTAAYDHCVFAGIYSAFDRYDFNRINHVAVDHTEDSPGCVLHRKAQGSCDLLGNGSVGELWIDMSPAA